MDTDIAIGELIAQRKFRRETIGGVPRFTPGQYASKKVSANDALVTYVDTSGAVCLVPCTRLDDGEWVHRGVVFRVAFTGAEVRPLPNSFRLTDLMVRAIQQKKRTAASSST